MTSQVEQFIPFEDPNFYVDDPYPVFARLQREDPVYYYEPLDIFVLTKIDDIREAARQADLFSSGHGLFLNDLRMQKDDVAEKSVFDGFFPSDAEHFAFADPPRHKTLRGLITPAFSVRNINDMKPLIEGFITELIAKIQPGDTLALGTWMGQPHGLMRALRLHRPDLSRTQREQEAARILRSVGLSPAHEFLNKFPYELSGGQRPRIGFAQALACRPELILADEPVSMLDVSIRIGLLNLMAKLRDEEGVSILYITHDIASARYVADRLIVMYAGHIAETGPIEDVLTPPRHPYTQLLLSAVPDPRAPLSVAAETDRGEPPRVIDPAPGCLFRWRCPLAIDTCAQVTPELTELRPGHDAACHVAQTSPEEVKAFS